MKRLLLLSLLASCAASKECHEHPPKAESSSGSVSISALNVSVDLLAATNKCSRELESQSGDNFKTMQAHVMMYDVTKDYYCQKIKKKARDKDLCETMSNEGRRKYYVRETINLFLSRCILEEYNKVTVAP